MRKWLFLAALLLLPFVALRADAQALTADEQSFIDQHIAQFVTTKATRLTNPALAQVFASPFYKIQVIIKEGDGESTSDLIVARLEDKLVNVSAPGTDGPVPTLLKMIDPKFKLAADADAAALQKSLDLLYPAFGDEDKKEVKFTHAADQWTFIRGKFFDSKKGYVFHTKPDGTITAINFLLKLP